MAVGVVTGLHIEARLFDALPASADAPIVRCSGARSENARRAAQELVAMGCHGLLSFGLAGGLAAGLEVGDLVVGQSVVRAADGHRFEADEAWRKSLMSALADDLSVRAADVAGVDTVAGSPSEKQRLAEATNAVIVDMESHAVAEAAAEAGIPFAVLRAVSDTATMSLPAWTSEGVRPDGSISFLPMIAGALTHPWDLGKLISLQAGSGRAKSHLMQAVRRLGPNLR